LCAVQLWHHAAGLDDQWRAGAGFGLLAHQQHSGLARSRPQWRGISLFAYFQVEDDIRTGRLVRVLPEAEVEPVPFYVTYPARQTLPARTRMVMNWIISEADR
jgi:DNA-binding transcriptional LysR family regulator